MLYQKRGPPINVQSTPPRPDKKSKQTQAPTRAREGAGGGVAVEERAGNVGEAQPAQLLGGVELVLVLLGQGSGYGDGLADVDDADKHAEHDLVARLVQRQKPAGGEGRKACAERKG